MHRPGSFSLVLAMVAMGVAPAPAAFAQQTDADLLVRSLSRAAPLTRSMVAPAPVLDADAAAFLKALPTRGLTIEARSQVAQIAQRFDLPQVDLDILFAFNADTLQPSALADVITLGRALTAPDLAAQRFVVAGHTDAVGSAAYNLDLSQRRAETVRRVLIESFDIPASRLVAVGFGFEQLKQPNDPGAAENRRVELINLEVGWD